MDMRALGRAIVEAISWHRLKLWKKVISVIAALLIVSLAAMYGIARWYIYQQSSQPLNLGVSYISDYARYLGLDPKQTLDATINDLGSKNIRFVSYWSNIESTKGQYDFSDLDWQFRMAEKANVHIILSIGLRQPRWPECHMPTWAMNEPKSMWLPQLEKFTKTTIDRYKNSSALQSYQLENEFFLKAFGRCTDYSRERLVEEYNFVKKADPSHPIIVSRSNNAIGLPIGAPTPDLYGISVYKRVWDKTITHRYFEYPFPAWFYAFLAGAGEIVTHKNMIIHELQAEPWPPNGIANASPTEQDKSMNATRLKSRFQYAEATGMKSIYFWGSEWWYYRKVKLNDPSDWNVAKEEFTKSQNANLMLNNKKSKNFLSQIDKNFSLLYKHN